VKTGAPSSFPVSLCVVEDFRKNPFTELDYAPRSELTLDSHRAFFMPLRCRAASVLRQGELPLKRL
jgi:hypothetical protein